MTDPNQMSASAAVDQGLSGRPVTVAQLSTTIKTALGFVFASILGVAGTVATLQTQVNNIGAANTDASKLVIGTLANARMPAISGAVACPAGAPQSCLLSSITATGGSTARPAADMLGDVLNLQSKGAVLGLDVSSLLASLAPGRYTLTGGLYRVSASVTIPHGVVLDLSPGSGFTVDAGQTLTIKGRIDTRVETQVFFGAGAIVGLRYNRPVWWGCNTAYNSGFDCAPSINAAVASAEASYSPGDPTHPSDGGRPTVDIGGGGFYGIASPINIHPGPSQQLDFKGSGILNGGSQISVLPSFVGDNAIDVHGVATGNNAAWDLVLRDFQIYDGGRKTAACVGFVPEGAGYNLNSGDERPTLIDNVTAQGCPIGLSFVNTLQARVNRYNYIGIGTSNNTGIYFGTAGSGAAANAGSMTLDDLSLDPCPNHSAGSCTETYGIKARASGAGTSVSAVSIVGNGVFWGSNYGVNVLASSGSILGDWFFHPGTQFDGYGCAYVKFQADGAGSQINDVHIDHNYHTAVQNAACVPHTFSGTNGGTLQYIFDTNNFFVLGAAAQTTIQIGQTTNFSVIGNITGGSGAANCAFSIGASTAGVVMGNVADVGGGGTPWTYGPCIDGASSNIAVTGNLTKGTSVTGANGVGNGGGSGVIFTGNAGP